MNFREPWILLFLPLTAVFVVFFRRKIASAGIKFSSLELLKGFRPTFKIILAKKMVYLRALVIVLVLMALARPRAVMEEAKIQKEGIDIVLALDCSGSMRAEDFEAGKNRKNRLEVVKEVVEDFISGRKSDRIGMVAFASRAYTVCPLTLDYDWLSTNLKRVEIGAIEDGTAVGSAISSSLNRLKETPAETKIIILLTDGVNNAGKISPIDAAGAAEALGVKIYTIGAGTKGLVPYPVKDFFGNTVYQKVKIEIDEKTLKEIASKTGGRYFRATDTQSLREIYREIDALEKTPVEEENFQEYKELFHYFLLPALLLLALEVILAHTVLRKIP